MARSGSYLLPNPASTTTGRKRPARYLYVSRHEYTCRFARGVVSDQSMMKGARLDLFDPMMPSRPAARASTRMVFRCTSSSAATIASRIPGAAPLHGRANSI